MREKHWSPDMLTRVDPTAWLPNVTLAGTIVRGLPGQCTDCYSWICSQEKEKCCKQRLGSERKEVPCSSFGSQGPKRKAEDRLDLEAPAFPKEGHRKSHRTSGMHLHGHEGWGRNWVQKVYKQAMKHTVHVWRHLDNESTAGSQERSAGSCKLAELPEVYTGAPTRLYQVMWKWHSGELTSLFHTHQLGF